MCDGGDGAVLLGWIGEVIAGDKSVDACGGDGVSVHEGEEVFTCAGGELARAYAIEGCVELYGVEVEVGEMGECGGDFTCGGADDG